MDRCSDRSKQAALARARPGRCTGARVARSRLHWHAHAHPTTAPEPAGVRAWRFGNAAVSVLVAAPISSHQQQLARRRGRVCGVAGAVTADPNGRAGVRGLCWVHAAGHNAVRSSAVSCCVSCAASCSEQCVRSGERAVGGGGDDGAARSSRRGGTWSGARLQQQQVSARNLPPGRPTRWQSLQRLPISVRRARPKQRSKFIE